jgi:hypothetical protein
VEKKECTERDQIELIWDNDFLIGEKIGTKMLEPDADDDDNFR